MLTNLLRSFPSLRGIRNYSLFVSFEGKIFFYRIVTRVSFGRRDRNSFYHRVKKIGQGTISLSIWKKGRQVAPRGTFPGVSVTRSRCPGRTLVANGEPAEQWG